MNNSLRKELPIIVIALLPVTYLLMVWNKIPAKVPVHWNWEGQVDRYGSKNELLLIAILLPAISYLIFTLLPLIDPKKKLNIASKKFQQLRMLFTIFMSVIALFIVYAAYTNSIPSSKFIFIGIGLLISILGNYFRTIKPNYFIGIRTPWTLESEEVWKKTHVDAGKLWFGSGIVIVLSSLLLSQKINIIVFSLVIVVITIIPVVQSYLLFRKQSKP